MSLSTVWIDSSQIDVTDLAVNTGLADLDLDAISVGLGELEVTLRRTRDLEDLGVAASDRGVMERMERGAITMATAGDESSLTLPSNSSTVCTASCSLPAPSESLS